MRKILIFIMINIFILAEGYEVRVETGILNGVAHELVYKDTAGTKLSELIWNLEGVNLIGLGGSFSRSENFKINGDLYFNYQKETSTMEDYDWVLPISNWTHWSYSPTETTTVYKFDLNYEYEIIMNSISLSLLGGYRLDYYDWVAIGGNYIYSDKNGGHFREYVGSWPDNQVGISYEQTFSTPYFGFISKWQGDKISLGTKLIYSPFVYATDKDIHHQRENGGMVFEGVFENGNFFEIDAKGQIELFDNLVATLSYMYSKYLTNTGYYTGYYLGTGEEYYGGYGSVGLDNETSTISLGLTYKF